MQLERTKNTIRNTFWGMINRLVMLICPFAVRTCIIYFLGVEYTGLTSLFSSILSMLSFAELGFGTAIVYSMYQPIADGNQKKICALMNLYKWIYRFVGCFIVIVGLILLPFLKHFINGSVPEGINIYVLYCIYLFNSVVSYWLFSYKNCLLVAFQRNDISSNVSSVVNFIAYLVQIIFLVTTRNYYLYVICLPVSTILINISTAYFTSKLFPNYKSYGKITKEEIVLIGKQVVGLMAQRLAFQSRNTFDSIIISSFIGLSVVGIYNNYFYLINAATSILAMLFTSMQGGIGNSVAKESLEKNYEDFRRINFMYMWLAGICTILLAVLFQPFMEIWVGAELMFPNTVAIILAYYFLAMKFTDTIGAYITATGLWWQCKYFYLVEGITNLVLNIVLGYIWGVSGVIIASIISVVFVNLLSSLMIIYKYYFKTKNIKDILKDDIVYFFNISIALMITYCICLLFPSKINLMSNIILFILKIICCMLIPNFLFLIFYSRYDQFQSSLKWVLDRFKWGNFKI